MAKRKQDEPETVSGSAAAGETPSGEASSGVLEPSAELEAALAEASEAVEAAARAEGEAAEGGGERDPEIVALEEARDAATEEAASARDQHLRLQAEFENFRRRGLKEKQEAQLFGHQNLVKELLPAVDNLGRAVEHAEQNSSEELKQLLQGVELVRRELFAVLERFGVVEIEAEGSTFDPAVHEALAQVPTADVEPNTVVDVMEKGYQLHDRMLRPARVVVSKAVAEPAAESAADD